MSYDYFKIYIKSDKSSTHVEIEVLKIVLILHSTIYYITHEYYDLFLKKPKFSILGITKNII